MLKSNETKMIAAIEAARESLKKCTDKMYKDSRSLFIIKIMKDLEILNQEKTT